MPTQTISKPPEPNLLPFTIILISLTIRIFTTLSLPQTYIYDESLVTTISRQPLTQLLDTISAEPHPPGFYLFLKPFPTGNPQITRLIIIISSGLLTLAALSYGYKTNVITKYDLSLGLSLFFASYTYASISTYTKQDSLTFPLLLASLFVFLDLLNSKKSITRKLATLHLLTLLQLFIGYLSYAYSLALTTTAILSTKKQLSYSKKYILIQLTFALISYTLWGHRQLFINLHRLHHLNDPNNFIFALAKHLSGIGSPNLYSTVALVIFTILIVLHLYWSYTSRLDRQTKFLLLVTLLLLVIGQLTSSFSRIRYFIPLLLSLSALAGWGLKSLTPNKHLRLIICSLFLAIGATSFAATLTQITRRDQKLTSSISAYTRDYRYGLISPQPLYPYVFLQNHPNPHLIPINFSAPEATLSTTITKDHLFLETKSDLAISEVTNSLQDSHLNNFFLILDVPPFPHLAASSQLLLSVLSTACSSPTTDSSPTYHLYVFSDCSFTHD